MGKSQREWVTGGIFDDFIVYDGQWRLHHIDNKLIDCRELPNEKPANLETEEAQNALEKLTPILYSLIPKN